MKGIEDKVYKIKKILESSKALALSTTHEYRDDKYKDLSLSFNHGTDLFSITAKKVKRSPSYDCRDRHRRLVETDKVEAFRNELGLKDDLIMKMSAEQGDLKRENEYLRSSPPGKETSYLKAKTEELTRLNKKLFNDKNSLEHLLSMAKGNNSLSYQELHNELRSLAQKYNKSKQKILDLKNSLSGKTLPNLQKSVKTREKAHSVPSMEPAQFTIEKLQKLLKVKTPEELVQAVKSLLSVDNVKFVAKTLKILSAVFPLHQPISNQNILKQLKSLTNDYLSLKHQTKPQKKKPHKKSSVKPPTRHNK